jgi:hypothetical protein
VQETGRIDFRLIRRIGPCDIAVSATASAPLVRNVCSGKGLEKLG